jgi:hypothetical protein
MSKNRNVRRAFGAFLFVTTAVTFLVALLTANNQYREESGWERQTATVTSPVEVRALPRTTSERFPVQPMVNVATVEWSGRDGVRTSTVQVGSFAREGGTVTIWTKNGQVRSVAPQSASLVWLALAVIGMTAGIAGVIGAVSWMVLDIVSDESRNVQMWWRNRGRQPVSPWY